MKFYSDKHHRRSLRLQDYDYSQAGAYFVTVCTQNRECLFGEVANDEMRLNDAGQMVERWWAELPNKFLLVETDEYVAMLNHFHGIVVLVGAALRGRPGGEVVVEVPSGRRHQRHAHPGTGHPHRGAPQ